MLSLPMVSPVTLREVSLHSPCFSEISMYGGCNFTYSLMLLISALGFSFAFWPRVLLQDVACPPSPTQVLGLL